MKTTTITCDQCNAIDIKYSSGGHLSADEEITEFIDVWQYNGKNSGVVDLDLTFCSTRCLINYMVKRFG